jgi:hypothetical protein
LRTRTSLIAVGICATALAACGGSGGGGVPRPVNTSDRPAASGDAFGYAGTITEQFVRPPVASGNVTPSPNPTNSQTLTTAVKQAVTVSTVATFAAVTNPYDFHVAETDTLNGGLETSTVTSDEYYTYTTSGANTTIAFAGSNVSTSDGSTFQTVIGSGNGLVDIIPEVEGTLSPANSAAETVTETDADGSTNARTVNADGTYTANGTFADGTTSSAVVNADGSGSYTFPLLIPAESSYSVSAPSGGNVTITVDFNSDLLGGGAEPAPFTVPVWYPLPFVASQESIVDLGVAPLPASCGVGSKLTKKAPDEIVDTKTTVDPVFGETDTTTTASFDERGIGVACVVLTDVLSQYYDLSGQTQYTLSFSNTPFQTTTTAETLGITSATVLGLSSVARASDVQFAAGISRFQALLAHRRTERRAAFAQSLATRFRLKGGHL